MNPMATLWLVVLVLSLVAEGATAAITTIWFATGALVAMLTALLGGEVWLQTVLFVVVSVGLLLALRPLLKKYVNPKKTPTNTDAMIGTQGLVLEEIDNLAGTGRVKLGGMEWSARSTTGEKISTGKQIAVDKIQGNKVFVTTLKIKEETVCG